MAAGQAAWPARSRTPARWSWTATTTSCAGPIRGSGKLVQQGVGDTFLTGDNTYSGGTVISAGTLRLGAGTTGSVTGDILNNSRLVIERSNEVLMTGLISGTGQLVQEGAGQTVLSGNNAYAGPTLVNFGSLYINGDQTAATGRTFVLPTATLGGTGIVGGDALVAGTWRPATPPARPAR